MVGPLDVVRSKGDIAHTLGGRTIGLRYGAAGHWVGLHATIQKAFRHLGDLRVLRRRSHYHFHNHRKLVLRHQRVSRLFLHQYRLLRERHARRLQRDKVTPFTDTGQMPLFVQLARLLEGDPRSVALHPRNRPRSRTYTTKSQIRYIFFFSFDMVVIIHGIVIS